MDPFGSLAGLFMLTNTLLCEITGQSLQAALLFKSVTTEICLICAPAFDILKKYLSSPQSKSSPACKTAVGLNSLVSALKSADKNGNLKIVNEAAGSVYSAEETQ